VSLGLEDGMKMNQVFISIQQWLGDQHKTVNAWHPDQRYLSGFQHPEDS
jgi:hypothetical protein